MNWSEPVQTSGSQKSSGRPRLTNEQDRDDALILFHSG